MYRVMAFVPFGAGVGGGPHADDAALARRVAGGDRAALAAVYRNEGAAVYRYALAMCGNPAWAADATQEAFIAFATRPGGFDAQRGSLAAYLAGAARHALLAQWRQQHEPLPEADDNRAEAAHEVSPEAVMVRAQSNAQLWQALRALPWPQREALVLVDVQERPYEQAAQIAGIELNTLRTRLHRGPAKLAARLAGAMGDAT
jgi:RNA polymerase sigma-70 factor, ECF subfamily